MSRPHVKDFFPRATWASEEEEEEGEKEEDGWREDKEFASRGKEERYCPPSLPSYRFPPHFCSANTSAPIFSPARLPTLEKEEKKTKGEGGEREKEAQWFHYGGRRRKEEEEETWLNQEIRAISRRTSGYHLSQAKCFLFWCTLQGKTHLPLRTFTMLHEI